MIIKLVSVIQFLRDVNYIKRSLTIQQIEIQNSFTKTMKQFYDEFRLILPNDRRRTRAGPEGSLRMKEW